MQPYDLNPLINYVLRIQFQYKMWRPLIALLHIYGAQNRVWSIYTTGPQESQTWHVPGPELQKILR